VGQQINTHGLSDTFLHVCFPGGQTPLAATLPVTGRKPLIATHVTAALPLLSCYSYGVGVGLYFKTLFWLKILFFWLAICMVSTDWDAFGHRVFLLACMQHQQHMTGQHNPHLSKTEAVLSVCVCWRSQIPYAVVINSAYFTTAEHKGDKAAPGMKPVPGFQIFQVCALAGRFLFRSAPSWGLPTRHTHQLQTPSRHLPLSSLKRFQMSHSAH
jgi:hypothetical protein